MSTKPKNPDVKVLKGQEAEDAVLQYIKRMNRPFGAVDISANLKGAVPKTATQKILVTLAEKGEIIQKAYGKTNFFVANQAHIESVAPEKLAALEIECKTTEEDNQALAIEVRSASNELSRLKSTPTDDELDEQISTVNQNKDQILTRLAPLRDGTPLISQQELTQLDSDWVRWRAEWVRRRKIFNNFWVLATDALPPQDATSLAEDLGIEFDTTEHSILERGPLCAVNNTKFRTGVKRKRD